MSYARYFIYLQEFIKHFYMNTTPSIEKFQIWVGQTCSLRCKHCSQLFPYIQPKIYDINDIIRNIEKILPIVNIESFHIIGGEPFTNKNINSLIEFICSIKTKNIAKIITNGTIPLQNNTLELLSNNFKKICISLSEYEIVSKKQNEFIDRLKEYKVNYHIVPKESNWKFLGLPDQKEILGNIMPNFTMCHDKTCTTLADGELSICPRMFNSSKIFHHPRFFVENLKIKYVFKNRFGKALVATCLSSRTYRDACRFCYGISSINEKTVPRAEQLK